MKRMLAGLMMIFLASASAQAADQHGMMGGRMMEIMKGMMCEGHNPWFHHGVTLLIRSAEKLGLNDKQKEQLEELRDKYTKEVIRQDAERQIAEMDVAKILTVDDIDLAKVKGALKKAEGIETQIQYIRIEAFVEARKLLTEEQKGKLKKLMEKPMAPMMMQDMMGEGMMGGMEGDGAEDASEGSMTHEKAAGGVTVIATFQNPEAANGKDDLLFEVKLDTHTVDLERFNFEKAVDLKDEKGKSYSPAKVELGGSGHHRSAVLTFKNPGKIKELKLLVKDLAGVKETIFEWEIKKGMMGQ